ncbi:Nucleobase-ascorbate transporter 11 [Zea mays]|uniref:Nucleobase-ascorbate transporter 11 n=2 Tax=Zea mays TaxID=4577 RepID=A0A1D6N2V8_MAIZE|nr:Nucleobase-ascorbate transporter 11 [Zea mays]
MLLVSGLTTILHTFLGSRLPLIQGSSFVYLAPALVIANSEEFRNLTDNKFKHIMRELQGAILVGSVFQIILGYTGLISLFLSADFLKLSSLPVGKIGALLASIPLALAASVLCFTWALIVALGMSTLRYTQAASSRNMIIVGFTLFISLSIPAYFQQYEPSSNLILPSYLLSYAAASSGPVHTASSGLNYALNALLSIDVVVALLVALILDNTVPGSRQERGVYI